MSKDPANGSNVGESQSGEGSNSNQDANEFVSKKAYQDVSQDMHRYKQQLRDTKAMLSEMDAKLRAQEDEKLAEQNRFKELYEKSQQELKAQIDAAKRREEAYSESVKKSALKSELGGKIKDQYLVHADVKGITFNDDGSIDLDSVHAVANKFRQEHPGLIPTTVEADATSKASPTDRTISAGTKTPDQLTGAEAKALLLQMGKESGYTHKR
jgi:hypothetical protein